MARQIVLNVPDLFWSAGGAVLAFMILAFAHDQLAQFNITAMCSPLGAVAVLLFALPLPPASSNYNTATAHSNTAIGFLVASAAAFGVFSLVGENFLKEVGGTRALMIGAAIAAMKITDSVHAPAGAYAVLLAEDPAMKSLGWKYILFPGFFGALILIGAQFLLWEVRRMVT